MEFDGLSQNPRHPSYKVKTFTLYGGGIYNLANNNGYKVEDPGKQSSAAYTISTATAGSRIYNNGDFVGFPMNGPTAPNTARPLYHDFHTPLLVKGLYKVWICSANIGTTGNGSAMQWVMNPGTIYEQVLPTIYSPQNNLSASSGVSLSVANSDNLLEAQGFKRYIALTTETAVNGKGEVIKGEYSATGNIMFGRLVGIANIKTTDRQWIRVRGLGGTSGGTSNSNILWLDMIHFIPLSMTEQQYPRFSSSGTKFYRP
jgi:hypothetical protein